MKEGRQLSDFRLRTQAPGNQKTTCPDCSHTRKKKHDKCLSITIESDGKFVYHCHNCGASGGSGKGPERGSMQHPRSTRDRPRNGGSSWVEKWKAKQNW